ncbi:MAG: response regulator, partial [Nitrospiraceae bacterium]
LGAMTVMMLTTDNRSADMARCHELGIGRCLIKPIRRADLIELVNAIRVEQSSAQEPAPALVTPASQDGAKVLLVEDFADNRMVIQAYLKKTPHRLDIAENGRVAVEKCQAERYDLVFMDVEMPVMDGHTATRTIRSWEKEKGVQPMPIIALTAHALKEQVQQSLDAGCTAHLSKPIRKAAVLDAIAAYASRPPAHRPPNGGQTEQKLIVRAEADLQAFIPEFLKSRHQDVLSITEALACGDFEHIRMVGHGIKGIGGCYGFDRISEVGHALEEAAQKKDAEEIRKHVEELAGYLQRIECVYASPPR